jgi:hypothetical protein
VLFFQMHCVRKLELQHRVRQQVSSSTSCCCQQRVLRFRCHGQQARRTDGLYQLATIRLPNIDA